MKGLFGIGMSFREQKKPPENSAAAVGAFCGGLTISFVVVALSNTRNHRRRKRGSVGVGLRKQQS
jgi:hypothetical protein